MQSAEIYFCAICTKLVMANWGGFVKIEHVQYAQKIDMKFVQCAQIRRTARDVPSRAVSYMLNLLYHIYGDLSIGKMHKIQKNSNKKIVQLPQTSSVYKLHKKRRRSDVSLFNLLSRKELLQATYFSLVYQES